MPRAIQITAYGGPEQLHLVDLPVGEPGPGSPTARSTSCSCSGPPKAAIWMARGMFVSPR